MTTFTVKKHTFQSAAVATGNGTAMVVAGLGTLGVQVEGITTATVTFEGTIDGTTWYSVQGMNVADGTIATTATADGLFIIPVAGLDQFRARISAWTTGTLTVTGRATSSPGGLALGGSATAAPFVDVTDRIGRLVGKMTNYDVLANGTLGALNETVELAGAGLGTIGIGISGTWVGTIVAEIQVGDSVWDLVPLIDNTLGSAALSTTGNGNFVVGIAGALTVRVRMSLYTSGTATVYLEGTSAPSGAFLTRSIPTGGNLIGSILGAAGENHLGQVGGEGTTIALTPTVTAGAYSAGDAVGGLLTFTNAGRASAEGSVLTDVLIIDDAGQDAELELWLFNQTFTAIGDNLAWAPSEADLENCIAVISTSGSTWRAAGTPSVINVEVTRRIDITGTSLFGQLVTRGTPTYAATDDLTVKVKLLQD